LHGPSTVDTPAPAAQNRSKIGALGRAVKENRTPCTRIRSFTMIVVDHRSRSRDVAYCPTMRSVLRSSLTTRVRSLSPPIPSSCGDHRTTDSVSREARLTPRGTRGVEGHGDCPRRAGWDNVPIPARPQGEPIVDAWLPKESQRRNRPSRDSDCVHRVRQPFGRIPILSPHG
jgi:hypothetical protein